MNEQSRTQSHLAFWSAGGHLNRLLDNRRHFFPRNRGVPVLECVFEFRAVISVCFKLAG